MRRVLVFAFLLAGCTVPVQHGLEESAANEVVTSLERAGIGAEKIKDEASGNLATFVVRTSRTDAAGAMELMRTLGLPRSRRTGLAEMYGQPSLVPSPTEERARFLEALGNDIERTLETIDGVVSARVHIVMAESDPLAAEGKPRVPAQASVLLKGRAGAALPLKEAEIQRLVAGAVPGLVPTGVAVIVTSAPEWSSSKEPTLIAFGPVRMTAGSRGVVFGVLASLLGTVALLALMLLFTARRLATAERSLHERRA